jgi:cytochrome c2
MNVMKLSGKYLASFKVAFLLTLLMGFSDLNAQDGAKIFKANCASCHRPTDQVLVGPGLAGTRDRWEGKEDLLIQWIQNPTRAKESNDPYINAMWDEWVPRAGVMPAQALNRDEVLAVLDYIDSYEQEQASSDGGSGGGGASQEVVQQAEGDPTIWMIVVLVVLIFVGISLSSVRSSLNTAIAAKEGKLDEVEKEEAKSVAEKFGDFASSNKILVGLAIVALIVSGLVAGWNALSGVGIFTEYEPEQPIAFSHSIHAGQNGISCVYCHGGAEKSKHAGIPSIKTCMNCHVAVEEGKNTGKEEIAKIYEAVGWDSEKRQYTGEEKPVKWIKVHNLPDHVYFNHKQHVVVGGVECQTCHGEVEKMGVAKQVSPLTMGWCIDCHNQTEVKMEGNAYYDEIHNRMSTDMLKKILEDNKVTVKELGGWECAKCHY